MKKLRKVLSLLLVGVITVTSLFCGTVTASAASSKPKLITASITGIDSKATWVEALGQDLYVFGGDNYKVIYRIGSKEISNWRKSGKLKPTKVKLDSEVFDHDWVVNHDNYFDDTNSEYAMFAYKQDDGLYHAYAVKYDKDKNSISSYFDTSDFYNMGVSSNGVVSVCKYSNNILNVKLINTSGKQIKTFKYDYTNKYGEWSPFYAGSQNAVVVIGDGTYDNSSIYSLSNSGKQTKISDNLSSMLNTGKNYIAWHRYPLDEGINTVYLTETKKTYIYNLSEVTVNNENYQLMSFSCGAFWGTKTVARYKNSSDKYKYMLIDVKNPTKSKAYNFMTSYDNGKTFLVKNDKGKWGYLNKNGKEIGWFDDASRFLYDGKYAPVIKNGKAYLIDRNMKQVSKTLKVDSESSVSTYGSELFGVTYGGKKYLMTYK